MFASGVKSVGGDDFVDRGNLNAYDFVLANFVRDGTWRDLDLSSIIPIDTKLVKLQYYMAFSGGSRQMEIKNAGHANDHNRIHDKTPIDVFGHFGNGIVGCDSDRKIKYKIQSGATAFDLVVTGWVV